MKNKPKGLTELGFNRTTGKIELLPVKYRLIKKGGKTYTEPIDKKGTVGIGDGLLLTNEWYPLSTTPCRKCGVYGLVGAIHIGKWVCSNCGDEVILSPEQNLHVKGTLKKETQAKGKGGKQ